MFCQGKLSVPAAKNSVCRVFYMSCVVDASHTCRAGFVASSLPCKVRRPLSFGPVWGLMELSLFCLPVLYKLVKIHAALLACSVDTHEDLGSPDTVLRPVPVEDLSGLCEHPWRQLTYVVMIIYIVDNKGE